MIVLSSVESTLHSREASSFRQLIPRVNKLPAITIPCLTFRTSCSRRSFPPSATGSYLPLARNPRNHQPLICNSIPIRIWPTIRNKITWWIIRGMKIIIWRRVIMSRSLIWNRSGSNCTSMSWDSCMNSNSNNKSSNAWLQIGATGKKEEKEAKENTVMGQELLNFEYDYWENEEYWYSINLWSILISFL